YIVDEEHMLTREAWNALLKILGEPPPRVVFVFATTEPQKIAQTAAPILSRLQRFDFRRIGPHAIVDRLRHVVSAEGLSADDEALHLIARSADGGMRDGLSMLDQVVSFGEGPVTAAGVGAAARCAALVRASARVRRQHEARGRADAPALGDDESDRRDRASVGGPGDAPTGERDAGCRKRPRHHARLARRWLRYGIHPSRI